MTDLTRIRELLAKAEKGSVEVKLSLGIWETGSNGFPLFRKFYTTPAQFAALKTEFPDKFNGEE